MNVWVICGFIPFERLSDGIVITDFGLSDLMHMCNNTDLILKL